MATAKKTPAALPAVVEATSHELALPADLMAELAADAKDAAAKERPNVSRISLKSGVMSYGGDPVPGNTMEVIIVGGAYRNVFYAGAYDPDNIVNPTCFALADDAEGMVPHENVTNPEHPTCQGCPKAEWGSAMRNGRPSKGKACKETRRIMVIAANDATDAESIATAEMAIVDLPVTSVGNYAKLVNALAATINLPVWAVRTQMSVAPHARNQFEVSFTPLAPAGGADVIRALKARRDEAMRIALTPYDGAGGEEDPNAGQSTAPAAAPRKQKF